MPAAFRRADRQRRDTGRVVAKDVEHDAGFAGYDLAIARGERSTLQRPDDGIAVAEAAAGLPQLDPPAKPSSRLVREVLQEQRVHRALEADVEMGDLAF